MPNRTHLPRPLCGGSICSATTEHFQEDNQTACYLDIDVGTSGTKTLLMDARGRVLATGTPVVAGAGDQPAGAVGNGVVRAGMVSATMGTSGVVFVHSPKYVTDPAGRVQTFCAAVAGEYCMFGCILAAGGSFQWFRNTLGTTDVTQARRRGLDPYDLLSRQAAKAPIDCEGLFYLPYLTGQQDKGPREAFFYFSDDGDLTGLRYDNWKVVFAQQRAAGTMLVWSEPFVNTRMPWLFNLRTDPYEKATLTSNTYWDWYLDHVFLLLPAADYVGNFLSTFQDYPPRQKAASFTIDQVMEQLAIPAGGG